MKKVTAAVVAIIFSVSIVSAEEGSTAQDAKALIEKQKQEREAFKQEGKEQREDSKDAVAKQHADNVAFMREKLADSKLTDKQKEEVVNMIEERYGKHAALNDERLKDLIKKIQNISNDDSKSMPEKKAALKEYIAQQKLDIRQEKQKMKLEQMQKAEADKKK